MTDPPTNLNVADPSNARSDESLRELIDAARTLDLKQASPLQVRRLSRELRESRASPTARLAFVGNVTFERLPAYLEVALLADEVVSTTLVAAYNQYMQAVMQPGSDLQRFSPSFLFLCLHLPTFRPDLHKHLPAANAEEFRQLQEEIIQHLRQTVDAALKHTRATILVANFPVPESFALGIADSRNPWGEQAFYAKLNLALNESFAQEPRVQIFDLDGLTAAFGRSRAMDLRLFMLAKMPWHESFLPWIADALARHVIAASERLRKCLVVDLDGTLWSGILGEDGPTGVRCGPGDPAGEAHWQLQVRLRALKQRGLLLAICSKNNPEDVHEFFRVRSDTPLRPEDFVALDVGWESKDAGLRRIAEQLNIGTDSLVFLDDNPAELELIRQLMPEVLCIAVPEDPAKRPHCLDGIRGLERAMITREDSEKTDLYRQIILRESARSQAADLRSYLESLATRVEIWRATPSDLARAHQLFSKTNQFNVTTRRYALPELATYASASDSCLWLCNARDRFGEFGTIGACLVTGLDSQQPHIDSFILSCRIMGRGVEIAVLNHLKRWCFETLRKAGITAELIPTAKNVPVRELFTEQGFSVSEELPGGARRYAMLAAEVIYPDCQWISLKARSHG